MLLLTKAISNLRPQTLWILHDNNYSSLEWLDLNSTKPTEDEINAEVLRLKTEYEAQSYARKRVEEYPSIGDQLDALFHAGVFPEDMAAQIQAIKDKYPKS